MITLDQALHTYSPQCTYETIAVTDLDKDNIGGFWFHSFVSGPNGVPAPDLNTLLVIADSLQKEGAGIDFATGITSFMKISQLAAFTKIIEVADQRTAITLYGQNAVSAMVFYLFSPSVSTGTLAKAAWDRFALYAKRYRSLTGITADDLDEFNKLVAEENLPDWLRLEF
jgi:hypothetical protein